jgi:hypothetical protein
MTRTWFDTLNTKRFSECWLAVVFLHGHNWCWIYPSNPYSLAKTWVCDMHGRVPMIRTSSGTGSYLMVTVSTGRSCRSMPMRACTLPAGHACLHCMLLVFYYSKTSYIVPIQRIVYWLVMWSCRILIRWLAEGDARFGGGSVQKRDAIIAPAARFPACATPAPARSVTRTRRWDVVCTSTVSLLTIDGRCGAKL